MAPSVEFLLNFPEPTVSLTFSGNFMDGFFLFSHVHHFTPYKPLAPKTIINVVSLRNDLFNVPSWSFLPTHQFLISLYAMAEKYPRWRIKLVLYAFSLRSSFHHYHHHFFFLSLNYARFLTSFFVEHENYF